MAMGPCEGGLRVLVSGSGNGVDEGGFTPEKPATLMKVKNHDHGRVRDRAQQVDAKFAAGKTLTANGVILTGSRPSRTPALQENRRLKLAVFLRLRDGRHRLTVAHRGFSKNTVLL